MKKILFILLAVLLLSPKVSGQWPGNIYPGKQLSDLNQTELQNLYQKSNSMKRAGKGICITGCVSTGIGLGLGFMGIMVDILSLLGSGQNGVSESFYNAVGGIFFGGLLVALIGTPIWSIGASHVKQINHLPNFVMPKISPSMHYIATQNRFVPGLTLSFSF